MIQPFQPHPLLSGPHRQTIGGLVIPARTLALASRMKYIGLGDGDQLVMHLDVVDASRDVQGVIVLVHGLAGSHASGYVARTAAKLHAAGFHVVRVDCRGCGVGWNLARQSFHAGRSADLDPVMNAVHDMFPSVDVGLVGFSLGAHLVLHYLATQPTKVPNRLGRALAIAPPIDLAECGEALAATLGGIYTRFFGKQLSRQYQSQVAAGVLPALRVSPPRTLREFDERITAPLGGFSTVEEYYALVSSKRLLTAIRVPTEILTAADDPMIPLSMLQTAEYSPCITLQVTRTGGHLGYIADRKHHIPSAKGLVVRPDRRWLDWYVVQWAMQVTTSASDERSVVPFPGPVLR